MPIPIVAKRIGWSLLAIVMLVGGAALGYLVIPGTPSTSRTLKFENFIVLPKDALLNVMDYLTLNDGDLFVTEPSSGSVFKIDLGGRRGSTGMVSELKGEPRSHGVVILASEDMGFITRSEANVVDVFEPSSLRRLGTIPVAAGADGALYDLPANMVYVANGEGHAATLIDPVHRLVAATIPLDGEPEFAVSDPSSELVYQNLNDTNAIDVIDLSKRSVVDRWLVEACDGPTGLAIDSAHRRLFVGCSRNSKLVVVNMLDHQVVAALDVGGEPDSVAFDPSLERIYTTGRSGVMSVIREQSPDTYERLDDISTHYGAHTLAVDLTTHRVYVAYASLFVAPRIAVFEQLP